MNDKIFASMAEQMRPDADVLASLQAQLEAEQPAGRSASGPGSPGEPVEARPLRRRFPPARWWIGIAAALAAVALMLPAAGGWPVAKRGVGAETTQDGTAAGGLDYGALYRAAAAAATRRDAVRAIPAAVDDSAASGTSGAVKPAAESSYQTNTQVAGIDEGDIVKSDGSSIFVASKTTVAILAADGASTRQVATIDTAAGEAGKPSEKAYTLQGPVVELELQGSTLVVLVTEYRPRTSALPSALPGPATSTMVPFDAALTKALLYDVSDPATPRFLASLGQSGGLVTTRLAGDLLYVVTDYTLTDSGTLDPDDPQTFVPVLTDGDKAEATKAGDCGVLPEPSGPSYTVVSSIDLGTRKRVDTQSVLGGAGTVFMSTGNLYLAAADWDASAKELARAGAKDLKQGTVTQLARIGIDDGRLSLAAQGAVPGTVLNQFALDEYQGNLRVVTSVEGVKGKGAWVQRASLFVLGPDLKTVGSISSLVSGESVQSVRFAGPVGYVVTFRQMDPLFAVDLAEPAKPRVLSALKIPGFSTYLHPWGDGQLLGLGRDATARGEDRGLKLSMFLTADPRDVAETAVLRVAGDDAEALSDHRAVLVDQADGLIGFAVTDWSHDKPKLTYQVFRHEDGKGFVLVKKLPLATDTGREVPSVRGLIIGGYLYLVSADGVSGYSTATFDRVAKVAVKG